MHRIHKFFLLVCCIIKDRISWDCVKLDMSLEKIVGTFRNVQLAPVYYSFPRKTNSKKDRRFYSHSPSFIKHIY